MSETQLQVLSVVGFIVGGVFLAIAIYLFVRFHIGKIIGNLTGFSAYLAARQGKSSAAARYTASPVKKTPAGRSRVRREPAPPRSKSSVRPAVPAAQPSSRATAPMAAQPANREAQPAVAVAAQPEPSAQATQPLAQPDEEVAEAKQPAVLRASVQRYARPTVPLSDATMPLEGEKHSSALGTDVMRPASNEVVSYASHEIINIDEKEKSS